jgi:hypothetical protein
MNEVGDMVYRLMMYDRKVDDDEGLLQEKE